MSKVPTSRLLTGLQEKAAVTRRNTLLAEEVYQPDTADTQDKKLTESEKKEIGDVITQTSKKVVELITFLDGLQSYWHGYHKTDVRKIRTLKNEVTAGYFSIGDKLRVYRIGDDELIQKYYSKVKDFDTAYKATNITSNDVKDFHESIKKLIVGELNKAFKDS